MCLIIPGRPADANLPSRGSGNPPSQFNATVRSDVAKSNILIALDCDAHVVAGTSALTETDSREIDSVERKHGRGVLGCSNFALTVVLMQRFAVIAARCIPQREPIDFVHDGDINAPGGAARDQGGADAHTPAFPCAVRS